MKPVSREHPGELSVLAGESRPEFFARQTLVEILSEAATRHAGRIAFRFGDQSLTYEGLMRGAEEKAAWLAARGVGPGKLVGLWLSRGLAYHEWSIAVLRAGAGFVPFDPDVPADRAAVMTEEAQLFSVLVDAASAPPARSLPCPAWTLPENAAVSGAVVPLGPSAADTAYVIFTSGSTGKPKGVQVSHGNAAHWVQAEGEVLALRPDDVVFQGFSPSFDMALEESWPALAAGATIEISPMAAGKISDRLPELLRERKVTVLHAVPTLVSLFPEPLRELRLLNLGGEACPPALAERWCGTGPRVLNTYGPTETTVTATFKELRPGVPVTIGRMLPNYVGFVVGESGEIVPRGTQGELWIGGPSVAMGYLHRPDLSAARFVSCPFPEWRERCPVLYRTGDLVSVDAQGDLVFAGRIDLQIKVRGHRVELGEIEALAAQAAGVSLAVVAPQPGVPDTRLVCFLLGGPELDLSAIRASLKETLPSYMLPSSFVVVRDLARLPSGKVDRKRLPFPALEEPDAGDEAFDREPTPTERDLAGALRKVLPGRRISLTANFFDELGGDSLLAACWVSALRGERRQIHVSIRHLYEGQTIERIGGLLDREGSGDYTSPVAAPLPQRGREGSRYLCGAAQAASLVLLYGILGMLVSSPYLFYSYVRDQWESIGWATASAVGSMILIPPFLMSTVVSLKWLIIGRIREGDYPLWGTYYFRLWLVRNLLDLVPARYFAGTPLYRAYWRSLGCRVGRDAWIGKVDMSAPDLVILGERCSVGSDVLLETMFVENGTVRIRKVRVGAGAYVGTSAVVGAGAELGAGSELGNMSFLERGGRIAPNDRWEGAPARPTGRAREPAEFPQAGPGLRALTKLRFLSLASLFPIIALVPFLPALILLRELDDAAPDWDFSYLYLAPVFALSYVLIFAAILIGAKWFVQGTAKTGRISVFSLTYLRKWFVDQIFELSLDTLHSLFATLYLPPLYRILGARIGPNCEISTASSVTFDLLEMGEESFIADNAVIGDPEVSQGWMDLRHTKIGRRAFVGNSALLPDGLSFPDNSLLGVLSLAPAAEDPRLKPGTSWLGVPAIPMLGRRSESGFAESRTFRPSKLRRAARLFIEGSRIIFSPALLFIVMVFLVTIASVIWEETNFLNVLLIFPFLYMATVAGPILLANVALKWAVVGRYKPGRYSMWSFFVWRTEAITAIYEATAVPLVLFPLCGTPFLPFILRLFGVKVGVDCFIDTTDFTEFDMVTIGDGATLNRECGPQTHLFEDRVMKVGPIELGAGVTLGSRAVVLLESKLGAGVTLQPLSLVMRGESLPPNSRWVGSPAGLESGSRAVPEIPAAKKETALAVS